jgi:hypothetical protein
MPGATPAAVTSRPRRLPAIYSRSLPRAIPRLLLAAIESRQQGSGRNMATTIRMGLRQQISHLEPNLGDDARLDRPQTENLDRHVALRPRDPDRERPPPAIRRTASLRTTNDVIKWSRRRITRSLNLPLHELVAAKATLVPIHYGLTRPSFMRVQDGVA